MNLERELNAARDDVLTGVLIIALMPVFGVVCTIVLWSLL